MKLADAPPPGWYPDPEGTSRLRWWEGTDWTDRYRARPSDTERAVHAQRTALAKKAAAKAGAAATEAKHYAGTTRADSDAIIAEVRQVARSEVQRAADLFSARARAATREIQPLISQYTNRFLRWIRFGVAIAVVLVIAWIVFQAIAQQSLFDWVGDRIDKLSE